MQLTTFLMFEGNAEEAMNFYVRTVPTARIVSLERWGESGPGKAGTVYKAEMEIAGVRLRFFDSPSPHAFKFTPSISLFIDCDSAAEIERLAAAFGDGGQFMMPLDNYGFSQKFAWVQDKFGVSWQINLP